MKTTLYFLTVVQIVIAGICFAASQENKPKNPDMAMVKQYVNAQSQIGASMRSKTPDWTAINVQFEITLPVVKAVDTKYKTHYADEIPAALKKCEAKEEYEINNEIVGKSFQHVTVLAIEQQLDLMGRTRPAKKADAEKIAAYFEVIRPTFARRDKGFFEGKKTLEAAADAALEQLSKADAGNFLTASRELEDCIARTYALSIAYEASEIEKVRDTDQPLARRHQVEASMVYRIVQPRIEKRSAKTGELILNMLKGNLNTINSQELEKNLTTGLGMKLR